MKQEAGMKRCCQCREIKPITEFNRDRTRRDGLCDRCKECNKQRLKKYREQNPEKERERERRRRKENPEKVKEISARSKRKRLYGLTHDVYLRMLSDQNNQCAICGLVFEANDRKRCPHVDHDHNTGAVRGLLCSGCNVMLGNSHDNPETLAQGIRYLKQHNQK